MHFNPPHVKVPLSRGRAAARYDEDGNDADNDEDHDDADDADDGGDGGARGDGGDETGYTSDSSVQDDVLEAVDGSVGDDYCK